MGGTYYSEKDPTIVHKEGSDGWGGGSGGFMAILMAVALLVIVFFFIFRERREDHHGYDGIASTIPMLMAGGFSGGKRCECETNCEVDRHLTDKLWHNDRDILEEGHKTQEKICCEEEKTRSLIRHEAERAEDKEWQKMLYNGMQKDTEIAMLKTELNVSNKLNCLERDIDNKFCKTDAEIGRGFCKTDHDMDKGFYYTNTNIDKGFCETPRRPQYYATGYVDDGYECPPRRKSRRDYCCDCD